MVERSSGVYLVVVEDLFHGWESFRMFWEVLVEEKERDEFIKRSKQRSGFIGGKNGGILVKILFGVREERYKSMYDGKSDWCLQIAHTYKSTVH